MGIRTGFTGFEVQWLGRSGSSRVQATVIYDDGSRAVHVVELARSGEVWQIGRVGD